MRLNFKKYYSNNHFFFIGIVIIGLIYSNYKDKKYCETIEFGTKSFYKVLSQHCRYSPKSQSSVVIFAQNKEYQVKLSSNVCENFPVNSSIPVFYLKKYDEYFYKNENYKSNRPFLMIVLLIALLPWTFGFNIFYEKNALKK